MSEDTAFEVGDTVCLKSGGDLMTIIAMDKDTATCTWFVKGAIKAYAFPFKAVKTSDGTPQEITINFGRKLPGDPSVKNTDEANGHDRCGC